MLGYVIVGVALVLSIIGSITDIQKREVSNWVSFGLIFSMLGLRVVEAFVTQNFEALWVCIGVGAIFTVMGLALFYSQQWGGADLKLMVAFGIGFGTLLPGFSPWYVAVWPFFLTFLVNFFIITVFYSVGYAIYKACKEPMVWKDFKKSMRRFEPELIFMLFCLAVVVAWFQLWLFWVVFLVAMWPLSKFLKVVEKNCMYREIPPSKLVEFDIPEKDIKIGKKIIVSRKDPNGMTLGQIAEIKKLVKIGKLPKRFKVKWGVPLVPVFPITLIISLTVGDLMLAFLQFLMNS